MRETMFGLMVPPHCKVQSKLCIENNLSLVQESLSLLLDSLLSSLSSSSVSQSSSFGLLLQRLLTSSLSLGLDNVLNQRSLVLEGVTLSRQVKAVVQVLVNLASVSVLSQQSSQDSQSSHPQNLRWHTSVLGTLSLTVTHVSTVSLGLGMSSSSGSRVGGDRLLDDGTVTVQLSDSLTRVSRSQLGGFVRVQPDLSLTNTDNTGSESLLSSKVSPEKVSKMFFIADADFVCYCTSHIGLVFTRSVRGKFFLATLESFTDQILSTLPLNDGFHSNYAAWMEYSRE